MIGKLFSYYDLRDISGIVRHCYHDKWAVRMTCNDGTWKYGMTIGTWRGKILVELDGDGGIISVDPWTIYKSKEYVGERWRNDDPGN